MRILILNQTFAPDVVSTAQHLADAAYYLAAAGHDVQVITSSRAYAEPSVKFGARESLRDVRVERVWTTGLGKSAKWRRAVDFLSFFISAAWRLLWVKRPDAVLALTSPPMIAALGAVAARQWRCGFCYWVMDLNPDEALAAGWLREGTLAHRVLEKVSRFALSEAGSIVALDRFMQDRLLRKGVPSVKVAVIPPWSHDDMVRFDEAGRKAFRHEHGVAGKFVVMYSGNHSPWHPLDTLLDAARALRDDDSVKFLFVGGGTEWVKVSRSAQSEGLTNICCLPYQPTHLLASSLSAADVHVVSIGDPFVGIVHPCKIYNMLAVGARVLCVGPEENHVRDILSSGGSGSWWAVVRHGDAAGTVNFIKTLQRHGSGPFVENSHSLARAFSQEILLPRLAGAVLGVAASGGTQFNHGVP